MITGVTGGKALPREIANQIIDRTDGVPLFIEELTKTVVESGNACRSRRSLCRDGPCDPDGNPDDASSFLSRTA